MTAWYNITEAETDPGAPPKSELWKAWWKNPLAIAEGSVGAPKVEAVALRTGLIAAINDANPNPGTTIILPTRTRKVRATLSLANTTSNTRQVLAALSSNGGSSWGTSTEIVAGVGMVANARGSLFVEIDTVTGAFFSGGTTSAGGTAGTIGTSGTLPGGGTSVNAIRFNSVGGEVIIGGLVEVVGGQEP